VEIFVGGDVCVKGLNEAVFVETQRERKSVIVRTVLRVSFVVDFDFGQTERQLQDLRCQVYLLLLMGWNTFDILWCNLDLYTCIMNDGDSKLKDVETMWGYVEG